MAPGMTASRRGVTPSSRADRIWDAALCTLGGYLVMVFLPAATLSNHAGPAPYSSVMGAATFGLVVAPLWAVLAMYVRGVRPRAPGGADPDADRRDVVERWIRLGRIWTCVGVAGIYAGFFLVHLVHMLVGGGDARAGGLPGLVVAILAPIVPRIVALAREIRSCFGAGRPVRASLVADEAGNARLADGTLITLDAASAIGRGARDTTRPLDVWLSGGDLIPGSGGPYRGAGDALHGVRIDTLSDRRFRTRAIAALVLELAALTIVPVCWIQALRSL